MILTVLTVINEDNRSHILYIDGVNVYINFLRLGENQTIKFFSSNEGTYNCYDRVSGSTKPIGQIKALKVTAYE